MLLLASSHIWSFSETEPPKNLLDEEKKAPGWAMVANRDLICTDAGGKELGKGGGRQPEDQKVCDGRCFQIFLQLYVHYVRTFGLEEAECTFAAQLHVALCTATLHARARCRQVEAGGRPAGSGRPGSHYPLHFIRVESADDGATSTILSLIGR